MVSREGMVRVEARSQANISAPFVHSPDALVRLTLHRQGLAISLSLRFDSLILMPHGPRQGRRRCRRRSQLARYQTLVVSGATLLRIQLLNAAVDAATRFVLITSMRYFHLSRMLTEAWTYVCMDIYARASPRGPRADRQIASPGEDFRATARVWKLLCGASRAFEC